MKFMNRLNIEPCVALSPGMLPSNTDYYNRPRVQSFLKILSNSFLTGLRLTPEQSLDKRKPISTSITTDQKDSTAPPQLEQIPNEPFLDYDEYVNFDSDFTPQEEKVSHSDRLPLGGDIKGDQKHQNRVSDCSDLIEAMGFGEQESGPLDAPHPDNQLTTVEDMWHEIPSSSDLTIQNASPDPTPSASSATLVLESSRDVYDLYPDTTRSNVGGHKPKRTLSLQPKIRDSGEGTSSSKNEYRDPLSDTGYLLLGLPKPEVGTSRPKAKRKRSSTQNYSKKPPSSKLRSEAGPPSDRPPNNHSQEPREASSPCKTRPTWMSKLVSGPSSTLRSQPGPHRQGPKIGPSGGGEAHQIPTSSSPPRRLGFSLSRSVRGNIEKLRNEQSYPDPQDTG